jgi:diguanylate cyclase
MDLLSFALGAVCTIGVQLAVGYGPARALGYWIAQLDLSLLPLISQRLAIIGSVIALLLACAGLAALVHGRVAARSRQSGDKGSPAVPMIERRRPRPDAKSGTDDPYAATRANLERQLAAILKLVAGYLDRNSVYSAAVLRVQDQLATNASVERVRQLVEILIRQNAEAMQDARALRTQLAQAREQTLDIRQRLHKAEQLTKLDALTSIANRRSLEEFLEREIQKSHSEQSPLCVVMTDIDHFKQVNDNFGHPFGDDVLKSFARLLQSGVRSSDLVARYGGEEFTVILPRTPMGNAYQMTDRVRRTLESGTMSAVDSNKALVKVTASFGIAEIREGEHAKQLLFRADRMLIEAKKRGRNLVVTDSQDRLGSNRVA